MSKQKKVLLCMYVDDFCGIKEESFNFSIERRYIIKKGKINRKSDEEIEGFPKDFWGDNISALTLLIGENGAGKTTLMRLLIKWLCQLSAEHFPQEKGALVISDGDEDKLIAFDKGKLWAITIKVNKEQKIVCIEDVHEIKKLLSDIRLAYYTDTMTDLELSDMLTVSELEFLQDESLLARLSNSIKDGHTVKNIKDCIKMDDFKRQMELFFKLFSYKKENLDSILEFPIRYMKFKAIKAGDKKSFKEVFDDNDSLIGETTDFWDSVFSGIANNKLPAIAKALLWGIFSGTIISLLQWERTLSNLRESIVAEQVRDSLSAYNRNNYYDWYNGFKSFFTNLFDDCKRRFLNFQCAGEFRTEWEKRQIKDKINRFLDTLKRLENGRFLEKWIPLENTQNIWEFRLEYFNEKDENEQSVLMQEWTDLWEHYLAVAHLMPKCRFDWKYASSGGKNQSNLYINLFNIADECSGNDRNQLWILLDEPDNTFHPDWERGIVQNLLEICSNFDINFQLLISTHSPIMLSDVPKQAAILLRADKKNGDKIEKKQQENPKSNPFGQQIYTLFNDAFFMKKGIIGAFADRKIGEVYSGLYDIEEQLLNGNEDEDKFKAKLKEYEIIIGLIDEPLLHGHLSQSFKMCMQRINEFPI